MTTPRIPVYKPSLTGKEKEYVNECLDTSWISSRGRFIPAFEEHFAAYTGISHAIAVSNGTVAIHLAMLALGITEGDEVIVPTYTYIATVNTVKYVQATPVFADCRKDTWQIDFDDVRKKITKKTKALLVVHLYGHPCEMDKLVQIAKEHNLFLIEDCAESIGSRYAGKHVGTFGHISTFSFYGNKTITTGEGGMVVSNDKALMDKVFTLKMQGVSAVRQYWHEVIGYNYKMTNICAAIGLAQLEQVDEFVRKKIQLAAWYAKHFDAHGIDYHRQTGNVVHSFWMFSILTKSESERESLRTHLLEQCGIETRPTFYPVHTMPMYRTNDISLPVSEELSKRGINLPSYPGLSKEEVAYIAGAIIAFLKA
jgi:perosamine synthetase